MMMWVKSHQKQLKLGALIAGVLLVLFAPQLVESALILLFAGGIPGTQLFIPAAAMLAFWTVIGITFMVWLTDKLTSTPGPVPASGKAFYHRSKSTKPVRGRKKTAERAVRRRYKKLEA